MKAGDSRQDVHVVEHVAEDEDAVRLAPVGNVTWGVAGDLDDREPGYLVALPQDAVDTPAEPRPVPQGQPRQRVFGRSLGDQRRVLGRGGVALGDPERDRERLANLLRGALVVGVDMGEGVRGDTPALQLAQDPSRGVPCRGVDEDVLDEVRVDGVRREAGEQPDPSASCFTAATPAGCATPPAACRSRARRRRRR